MAMAVAVATGAAATAGAWHAGASGATITSWVLWHARIEGSDDGATLWSGQWQFVGSGQQHTLAIHTVRSCDTGTASPTKIATTTVAIRAAIQRARTR